MALEKETGAQCEADIITWRGMITKARYSLDTMDNVNAVQIMATPFDHMNGYRHFIYNIPVTNFEY